jgi:hypothetical protein
MRFSCGWVIVGAGGIVTCIGFGTAPSLLQPMSVSTAWSRAGVSTAATIDFLCMGFASLFWGARSARLGARTGSIAQLPMAFAAVGAACGSFYAPLAAVTTRWFDRHRSLELAIPATFRQPTGHTAPVAA